VTALHFLIIQTNVAIILYKNVRSHSTIAITSTRPTMPASTFTPDNKVPVFFEPSVARARARGTIGLIALPVGRAALAEHQVSTLLKQESSFLIVGDEPVAILQSFPNVKAICCHCAVFHVLRT
jgi:hypothetical protein